MSTSTSAPAMTSSTSVYASGAFWERLWRLSGIQFVVLFIIAYLIYGSQPQVGASVRRGCRVLRGRSDTNSDRRGHLGHCGPQSHVVRGRAQDGLGGRGARWLGRRGDRRQRDAGRTLLGAALAYSIASSGNRALTTGLNDFAWASVVLSSFPRAMLIMSSAARRKVRKKRIAHFLFFHSGLPC